MDDIISEHQHAARSWLDAARLELQDTMQGPEPLAPETAQATRALLEELAGRIERTIHPEAWRQAGSWEIEPEHLYSLRAPSLLLGGPARPFYQLVWQRAQSAAPDPQRTARLEHTARENILNALEELNAAALTAEEARACFEFLGLSRKQYAKKLGVARSTTLHWEQNEVPAGTTAALLRLLFAPILAAERRGA